MVDALLDLDGTLVISGKCADERYYHLNHVTIKSHINQMEVLKHCDVFITHGGMNSVNEGLYWGVPLCIHPFQIEQNIVADRVVELECGGHRETIEENIRREPGCVNRSPYRESARCSHNSLSRRGGYRKADEYILAYIVLHLR
jgi:UDP:flavonoid glycosyltransferase YjiC (YdhE family)